ncbi:hypothetical protein LENED_003319 [Lentinula edodes]|uniref:Uncharacterized protein n=2 Tax=Lentinula edodes TaxID=5353 RepID=A0A1Q3E3W0_LENED|nr:hypothetical protein LENED_003319 [Lentinula edodes]
MRNKVLREAEVVVQAASAQLGEQLNNVEQNIEELRKLTSLPSTPTRSQRVHHVVSLATSTSRSSDHHPPPPSPTSHQPRKSSTPLTPTGPQKVRHLTSLSISHRDHRPPLPTSTSHQPHQSSPPSTQTYSKKVPEIAHSSPHSPTPVSNSHRYRQSVPQDSGSSIPSNLVWISSDEEAGYPEDSEDSENSEDLGDDRWVPMSAMEVSSDEDEPLPGPGGVGVAEIKARRAQKFSKAGEKTYVVYYGRNGTSGLYFEWRGSHGATGALELTGDFADAVHRSFNDRKLAAKAYKECKRTGVLDIFKTPSSPKENLILIKGENPGVYNRYTLMKQGLRWHGGKVIVHIGTAYDAQQMFLALEREGKTMKLPKEKSWGLN